VVVVKGAKEAGLRSVAQFALEDPPKIIPPSTYPAARSTTIDEYSRSRRRISDSRLACSSRFSSPSSPDPEDPAPSRGLSRPLKAGKKVFSSPSSESNSSAECPQRWKYPALASPPPDGVTVGSGSVSGINAVSLVPEDVDDELDSSTSAATSDGPC